MPKQATSPTQNSLRLLRKEGYLCAVVEKWNPHCRIRQDLFGFIDVLAIKPGETLAVQVTSRGEVSKRIRKIEDHENLAAVREANWRIEVHGWDKQNNRYRVKRVDIS